MLDAGATYHVCPNRDWFFSFEKLDGCSVVMGDDHPCNMEGIGTIHIKMFDGMEALGLKVSIGDGVLKMIKDSMVISKGVRHNNLYYLKVRWLQGKWQFLHI